MKFTLSWLKDHLDMQADVTTIGQTLTRIGLEVEGIEDKAAALKPYVVARVLTAEQVVFAAASLGTQKLLHRMKDEGHLSRLSDRLGLLSRTNSESILGAIAPKTDPTDYSYGIAITSSWHPDDHTHIEPCRYGKGFNTMAMLQTVLTDGDPAALESALAFLEANPARFTFLAVGSPRQERVAEALVRRGRARGIGLCIGASLLLLTLAWAVACSRSLTVIVAARAVACARTLTVTISAGTVAILAHVLTLSWRGCRRCRRRSPR